GRPNYRRRRGLFAPVPSCRALPRGLFEYAADAPALVFGERTRLDNLHAVAFLALAALVMRHEAGAAAHALAVERMLDHAVHPDHDGLGHFGGDHSALAPFNSLAHRLPSYLFRPQRRGAPFRRAES